MKIISYNLIYKYIKILLENNGQFSELSKRAFYFVNSVDNKNPFDSNEDNSIIFNFLDTELVEKSYIYQTTSFYNPILLIFGWVTLSMVANVISYNLYRKADIK